MERLLPGGLHYGRPWNVDGASFMSHGWWKRKTMRVGTSWVIWAQRCANGDCCLEDCIREGCGMQTCPVSWKKVLWGSNLSWHSTSFMGSVMCHHRRMPASEMEGEEKKRIPSWKVDVTSLMPGGRRILWVISICWHSMSPMASSNTSCYSMEGKNSFPLLYKFSFWKIWWWLIMLRFINLGGRGFRGAKRRSCCGCINAICLPAKSGKTWNHSYHVDIIVKFSLEWGVSLETISCHMLLNFVNGHYLHSDITLNSCDGKSVWLRM